MNRQIVNIVVLLTIGLLAFGTMEWYFHRLAKDQEWQRQMILDLQKFNDFQHKVISAGGTNDLPKM